MRRRLLLFAVALATGESSLSIFVWAQAPTLVSDAQRAQAQASAEGKYSFIVFYRGDDALTRAMKEAVAALAAERSETVAPIYVQITNPAEQAIVRQYDVGRAPMPLTMVTAPNGAITGAYPQRVSTEKLSESFVTPAMSHCMKSMQRGRLVILSVQTTSEPALPQGVSEFLADGHYKDRTDVVYVKASNPAETDLLAELEFNAAQPNVVNTVLFAPPGVMVGKFGSTSSMSDIAAALHKAGKCCDDPNCKHNRAAASAPRTVR